MIDNGLELGANEATIGKAFQSAGYATGYIGKWHLGGVRAEPFGFNTSLIWTGESKHWQGAYHPRDAKPVQSTGYNAARMTDQALEFIKANRKRPFFLMLSLHPPHSNFLDPPEAKKALYPKGSLPWRPNVPEAIRQSDSEDKSVLKQNGWPFYRGYHAHISAIDDELGRIMAALEKSGIDERTILVYSSDHGSMHGSHACGGKRMPQEESIRVPFLARGPGIAPGTVADALFGTIDVMPTLCSLAGVAIPSSCVGQDFSGWCRGGKGPDPETQFIMHISKENASGGINHPAPLWRGVRTRRHTYAVRAEKSWLLHDNQDDPYQMKNLVEDPAAASVKERLHTILVDQLKRAGDPFVMPW
jgi:arylsulfatase A-like enzyme